MGRPRKGLQLSRACLRELERHRKAAKNRQAWETILRLRGLIQVSQGRSYRDVADVLGVTVGTISHWVNRYLSEGVSGLDTKPRSGRPRKLSPEQLWIFEGIINAGAMAYGFPNDLWDAKRAARVIRESFGVSYHPNHVAKILHQRGFSVQRPSMTLARADQEAQKRWEKQEKPRIARRAKKKGR